MGPAEVEVEPRADAGQSRPLVREAWLERASLLPATPGVYLLKDQDGVVVYVGKAKNLRNRVRSYFQARSSDGREFIRRLASLLGDIETVITRSEKEALLVEREMIRRHSPRFNVIWRDDKQYLCLRVDPTHEYPWVEVVRQMGDDGARYFGPFHSASAARRTLRVVNRHFRLRTCRDAVLYHRTRPCLEYQIGRCPAPCVLDIDRVRYRESVEDVLMFLDGNGRALAKKLEGRMWEASERQEYEVAAHYRDQRDAVERTLERQQVVFSTLSNQDVFGLYRERDMLAIAVLEVRRGRVENVTTQLFREPTEGEDDEVLESFLLQRYAATEAPPEEILTPVALRSADALAEILGEQRGRKVRVLHPKRGDRRALLALAAENAAHGFREQERKLGNTGRALVGLKERLRLTRIPVRIECYDISNFQGAEIVGSRVVFEHGAPKKAAYRRYRVKTIHGQDDFASLYEVLSRRVRRGIEADDLPDLMVIDGGRGQLNVAKAVFRDYGIKGVDLVSLAKSRVVGSDADDATVRSSERVFLVDEEDPVVLARASAELHVLTRLRDEAHRFAISFHRDRRGSKGLRSRLQDAPGIGPRRRKALLSTLGSLKRIEAATRAELAEVPGLGRAAAEAFFRWLHPDPSDDLASSGGAIDRPAGDEAGHTQDANAPDGDA
ncbi:MAG: excinuclease ABC subunit UvrC [Deltaproteobacteria bacterium]|nr:excinuclease ABC subunit UvrC [Deltaproteobacteria bacterium]